MSQESGHYYVPAPSMYPIIGSTAILFMGSGAALTMNKMEMGYGMLAFGFAILVYMLFGLQMVLWLIQQNLQVVIMDHLEM